MQLKTEFYLNNYVVCSGFCGIQVVQIFSNMYPLIQLKIKGLKSDLK